METYQGEVTVSISVPVEAQEDEIVQELQEKVLEQLQAKLGFNRISAFDMNLPETVVFTTAGHFKSATVLVQVYLDYK